MSLTKTLIALLVATSLVGCTAPAAPTSTTLTVFAAASLKGAFTTIGANYTAAHPDTTVSFSFDGSSTLVDQLKGGARADVFASADEANMTKATDASLISGTPTIFAANTLTLVVPPGNPGHVTGLDDSLTGAKLVICARGVPCGNATATLAMMRGVTLRPVSEEQKVTDVLGKVTSGEADAGIVYATDADSAGDKVMTVAIDGAESVINRYPIGVTASSTQLPAARAFVDYVTGPAGQAVLTDYGFDKP